MLENNRKINWLPDHIRDGRFGNFLDSNVDWALSRERYWGTPLPIWVCEQTGRHEAVDSYDELVSKPGADGLTVWEQAKQENPQLPEDLKVHKPYIDAITYDSPFAQGARMRRVPEVIDCWFDSGAMPFAQWGYPHQGEERFREQFPADFISEAIDQTRGWFYSLLAISTLMFSETVEQDDPAAIPYPYPHPYRNCIVLGLMLAEDGGKMSKSKRNYREPREIFDRYGADALRWYFFANQPPWTSIRYSERAIKDSIPEFLLRLWNVYSFFAIYANIDQFEPEKELAGEVGELQPEHLQRARTCRPIAERSELDRWILSELNQTVSAVIEKMDAYDNFAAAGHLKNFVDALSNWYVRRSRDRFWSSDPQDKDKIDAYWTLYECLLATSKLIAPFTPFLADHLWLNLTGTFADRVTDSVHLCHYPVVESGYTDESLSRRMRLAREISSLGRSARMAAKLKVRQPLAKVQVILADQVDLDWLKSHDALIRTELNVKEVEFVTDAPELIRYQIQPNFKRLGPRVGKLMPELKKTLANVDGGRLLQEMRSNGHVKIDVGGEDVTLDEQDIQIRLQAEPGWAAAQGDACVVVLNTELTDELLREGLVRDLVRLIQEERKQAACQYTDRIVIRIETGAEELRQAIQEHRDYLMQETLANELRLEPVPNADPLRVGPYSLNLAIAVDPHRE